MMKKRFFLIFLRNTNLRMTTQVKKTRQSVLSCIILDKTYGSTKLLVQSVIMSRIDYSIRTGYCNGLLCGISAVIGYCNGLILCGISAVRPLWTMVDLDMIWRNLHCNL